MSYLEFANSSAFPSTPTDRSGQIGPHEYGLTIRAYLAAKSPPAPEWWMDLHRKRDRSLNPHNESTKPPIRGEMELMAAWAVAYADTLMKTLQATPCTPS